MEGRKQKAAGLINRFLDFINGSTKVSLTERVRCGTLERSKLDFGWLSVELDVLLRHQRGQFGKEMSYVGL